jgi:hypothetical protein
VADGGMLPPGTPMWDPDDVECYIPLDPEDRVRSASIWAETARRLGASDG